MRFVLFYFYIIGPLLCLSLLYALFSSRYRLEPWSRLAVLLIGGAGVTWSVLSFIELHIGSADRWYPLASHVKSVCAGIVIGLGLVLALTREFSKARQRVGG
jgi:hypothetical protein